MSTVCKLDKRVNFLGYDCDIELHEYLANKQTAIQLIIADTDNNANKSSELGEPMCMATVCLQNHLFKKHETAIKNYSENEGILDVLVDAGIVRPTGKHTTSGLAIIPIVEFTL